MSRCTRHCILPIHLHAVLHAVHFSGWVRKAFALSASSASMPLNLGVCNSVCGHLCSSVTQDNNHIDGPCPTAAGTICPGCCCSLATVESRANSIASAVVSVLANTAHSTSTVWVPRTDLLLWDHARRSWRSLTWSCRWSRSICHFGIAFEDLIGWCDLREDENARICNFISPERLASHSFRPRHVPWALVITVRDFASSCGSITLCLQIALDPLHVFQAASHVCLVYHRPDPGAVPLGHPLYVSSVLLKVPQVHGINHHQNRQQDIVTLRPCAQIVRSIELHSPQSAISSGLLRCCIQTAWYASSFYGQTGRRHWSLCTVAVRMRRGGSAPTTLSCRGFTILGRTFPCSKHSYLP